MASMSSSFNLWLEKLNCIIENRFYGIYLQDEGAEGEDNRFGKIISSCKYLLCTSSGFFGLEEYWRTNKTTGSKEFKGFILHDIGSMLSVFGKSDLDYKFCSFHVIGDSDETTLFLVVQEQDTAKYHYLYLNESSIDETYGFTEIDSVVVD